MVNPPADRPTADRPKLKLYTGQRRGPKPGSPRAPLRKDLDFTHPAPLPQHSTGARPGSEEKLAVMRERLARKESLHHPDDLKLVRHVDPIMLLNWIKDGEL